MDVGAQPEMSVHKFHIKKSLSCTFQMFQLGTAKVVRIKKSENLQTGYFLAIVLGMNFEDFPKKIFAEW